MNALMLAAPVGSQCCSLSAWAQRHCCQQTVNLQCGGLAARLKHSDFTVSAYLPLQLHRSPESVTMSSVVRPCTPQHLALLVIQARVQPLLHCALEPHLQGAAR